MKRNSYTKFNESVAEEQALDPVEEAVVEETVEAAFNEPIEEPVEVAEEPVPEPEEDISSVSIVANCKKLNVRMAPNKESDVVSIITEGTPVVIDNAQSTDDFYAVCAEVGALAVSGYCMKTFIKVC